METVYSYATGTVRLLAFTVEIVKGDIKLTVHDKYNWVNPSDVSNYDLLPADIPIAMRIREIF